MKKYQNNAIDPGLKISVKLLKTIHSLWWIIYLNTCLRPNLLSLYYVQIYEGSLLFHFVSKTPVNLDDLNPLLSLVLERHVLPHLPDQLLLADEALAGPPPGLLQLHPRQLDGGQPQVLDGAIK